MSVQHVDTLRVNFMVLSREPDGSVRTYADATGGWTIVPTEHMEAQMGLLVDALRSIDDQRAAYWASRDSSDADGES